MNISELKIKWKSFKDARNKCPIIDHDDFRFITIKDREKMIDFLFKEIERIKNE